MKYHVTLIVLILAAALAFHLAGCGGSGTNLGTDGYDAAAVDHSASATVDGDLIGTAAAEVLPAQGSPPTLTLSLNSALNQGGTVKVTTINGARLYRGTTSVTATIVGGNAVFNLTGLGKGFYNIIVNGKSGDLVPTRIADPTVSTTQFVSTTLRNSLVGGSTDGTARFKFKTWSKGQSQHAVVKYTDGTPASPIQYAYGIIYLKASPRRIEFHRMGAHTRLISHVEGHHNMTTWIWGSSSHGAGSTASCSGCHGTLSFKKSPYTSITKNKGWCYLCHYGPTGAGNGIVHPLQ